MFHTEPYAGWPASSDPLGYLQKSAWASLEPIFLDRNGPFGNWEREVGGVGGGRGGGRG